MSDIDAFPLTWPVAWPRTRQPQSARFDTSFAVARDGLLRELHLLGAKGVIISSNVPLRRDGLPYARAGQPEDVAIAVYFLLHGEQKCIPCDRWDRVEDNLQAIRKTVEALRGLERWGARHMVDAAFQGFAALPERVAAPGWWTLLGVERDAPLEVVSPAYRRKLMEVHPDKGGDIERYHAVQEAWDQFGQERRRNHDE